MIANITYTEEGGLTIPEIVFVRVGENVQWNVEALGTTSRLHWTVHFDGTTPFADDLRTIVVETAGEAAPSGLTASVRAEERGEFKYAVSVRMPPRTSLSRNKTRS